MIIRFHCSPWNREMESVVWLCKLTNIRRTALSNIDDTHTHTRACTKHRFDQWIACRRFNETTDFDRFEGTRFCCSNKEHSWDPLMWGSPIALIYHHAWHASTGLKLTFINSIPCRGMYTESSIQLGSDYTTYRRTGLRNRMRTFLVNES